MPQPHLPFPSVRHNHGQQTRKLQFKFSTPRATDELLLRCASYLALSFPCEKVGVVRLRSLAGAITAAGPSSSLPPRPATVRLVPNQSPCSVARFWGVFYRVCRKLAARAAMHCAGVLFGPCLCLPQAPTNRCRFHAMQRTTDLKSAPSRDDSAACSCSLTLTMEPCRGAYIHAGGPRGTLAFPAHGVRLALR